MIKYKVIRSYDNEEHQTLLLQEAFDKGWQFVRASEYIPENKERYGYIEYIVSIEEPEVESFNEKGMQQQVDNSIMTVEEYRERLIQAFHESDCDRFIALVCLPTEKEFKNLEWLLKKEFSKPKLNFDCNNIENTQSLKCCENCKYFEWVGVNRCRLYNRDVNNKYSSCDKFCKIKSYNDSNIKEGDVVKYNEINHIGVVTSVNRGRTADIMTCYGDVYANIDLTDLTLTDHHCTQLIEFLHHLQSIEDSKFDANEVKNEVHVVVER